VIVHRDADLAKVVHALGAGAGFLEPAQQFLAALVLSTSAFAISLEHEERVSAARLGSERGGPGPLIAGLAQTELERVAVQFIYAEDGLLLRGVGQVDRFRRDRRIQFELGRLAFLVAL